MENPYEINFETSKISEEEANSKNFIKLKEKLYTIFNKYEGRNNDSLNFYDLIYEVQKAVAKYRMENPDSTLYIKTDDDKAFAWTYLTVKEIADLHKKYCPENYENKSEYTNMEVNNMLFDLNVIKVIKGYDSPAVCYDLPFHNNKICNGSIYVNKRVLEWI